MKSLFKIKPVILAICSISAGLVFWGISANQEINAAVKDYKMAAGFEGGTYFKIGESLNKLPGFKVKVQATNGSTENIRLVRKGQADFGITQLDILENLSYFDSSLKDDVKILFLLYKEEIHFLTKKNYSDLRQLKGKKVALGAKNSGTYSTSQILVAAVQLNENAFVIDHSAPADAIKKLIKGDVEGVLFVGGAPVDFLNKIEAKDAAKFHFVSFGAEVLQFLTEGYLPYIKASLDKTVYPNIISDSVTTVSTNSAIIVRKSMSDAEVEDIIKSIFKNRKLLNDTHPKWKEVKVKETRDYYNKNKEIFHDAVVKTFKSL